MLKQRPFPFPKDGSVRVICDTDCFNEADDQYAVAHLLMTPRLDVRGVVAAHRTHRPGLRQHRQPLHRPGSF